MFNISSGRADKKKTPKQLSQAECKFQQQSDICDVDNAHKKSTLAQQGYNV